MDYVVPHQGMVSAAAMAEERTYRKVVGKTGRTWLVSTDSMEGEADHIYVEGSPKDYPRGFGGDTLKFRLVDGSVKVLTGPWQSNSEALFADTDIDVRDKHRTFVVVGERWEFEGVTRTIKNVLYIDRPGSVIGRFDRGDEIAQNVADRCQRPVVLYSRSSGGSSSKTVNPTPKETSTPV